jgi:hypothetical protein
MIATIVYVLCALTAALCAVLLLQAWRRTRQRFLFWSGLCFVALTASNTLLVVDLVIVTDVSLFLWRTLAALVGLTLLLYGLIWTMD